MTAWMATKNYWDVDFDKTIILANRANGGKNHMFIGEDGFVHASKGTIAATVWKIEDAGDGYVRFLASCGKYLTVADDEPETYASMEDYAEDDRQKWKLIQFTRNYYILVHKKSRCALYENFLNGKYRLFSTEKDSDTKYLSHLRNNNTKVNALFCIKNAPWNI